MKLNKRLSLKLVMMAACVGLTGCDKLLSGALNQITAVTEGSISRDALIGTKSLNWDKHISSPLQSGNFTLHVCKDHFPPGSDARKEIDTAVGWYNKVNGANIKITVAGTEHKSIDEMYATPSNRNYFDYVDNSKEGFPCHGAGDTESSSWVMNTCKYHTTGGWNGSGDVKYFSIAVNANAKTHDTDATATDYPKAANIAHELGHAFGMRHTSEWPASDTGFISTMEGNLDLLSAYDIGFLRHFYPASASKAEDLVASPVIREADSSDIGYSNTAWEDANPDQLYLKGDLYYDCKTNKLPVFKANWFNTGTDDTNKTVYLVHRFRIGPKGDENSADKVTLTEWKAAAMGAASQDGIRTALSLSKSDLEKLDFDKTYRLTFKTDAWDLHSETSEAEDNNGNAKDIVLRSSQSNCH